METVVFYNPPTIRHPLPPRPPLSAGRAQSPLSRYPSTPSHPPPHLPSPLPSQLPSRPYPPYPSYVQPHSTKFINQDTQTTGPPSSGRKVDDDTMVRSRSRPEGRGRIASSNAQTGGGYDNEREGKTARRSVVFTTC